MDPGRRNKEHREADFIAVGDVLINDNGLQQTVSAFQVVDEKIAFSVQREHNGRVIEDVIFADCDQELLCKTVMGPTH